MIIENKWNFMTKTCQKWVNVDFFSLSFFVALTHLSIYLSINPHTPPAKGMRLSLACLVRHTPKTGFVHREVRHQSADNNTNTANVINLDEKDKYSLSISRSYLSLHTMREREKKHVIPRQVRPN